MLAILSDERRDGVAKRAAVAGRGDFPEKVGHLRLGIAVALPQRLRQSSQQLRIIFTKILVGGNAGRGRSARGSLCPG